VTIENAIAELKARLADVNRRIRELRRGRYTCRPKRAQATA
jgi:hypothetical protein